VAGNTCELTDGGFNSGVLTGGKIYNRTMKEAGKIWYVCTVGTHCASGKFLQKIIF